MVPCVVYPFLEGSLGQKTQSFGTLTVPSIAKCSRIPWTPSNRFALGMDDSSDSEASSDTENAMSLTDDLDEGLVRSPATVP